MAFRPNLTKQNLLLQRTGKQQQQQQQPKQQRARLSLSGGSRMHNISTNANTSAQRVRSGNEHFQMDKKQVNKSKWKKEINMYMLRPVPQPHAPMQAAPTAGRNLHSGKCSQWRQ
jgi:hypothetical protein